MHRLFNLGYEALCFADLVDLRAAGRAGSRGGRLAVLHRDVLRVLDVDLFLALEAISGNGHDTLLCWLLNAQGAPKIRLIIAQPPEFDSYSKIRPKIVHPHRSFPPPARGGGSGWGLSQGSERG